MKKNRKYKKIKIIMVFTTVLLIAFVAVVGLYKTGIYRFDFFKDVYKKIDFQLSTNELNIPQDALSFSVYDIEQMCIRDRPEIVRGMPTMRRSYRGRMPQSASVR